jgi:hypothetical protein
LQLVSRGLSLSITRLNRSGNAGTLLATECQFF